MRVLAAAIGLLTLAAAPDIALRPVDAERLALVRRNPTPRLRLINVWATWCAPCLVELPDLVAIDRAYRGPRFETLTVSADDAEHHAAAEAVLRRSRAAFANYRFTGELPALVSALDPAWTGGLPFSLLVAPGGEVLLRSEGTLEIDRLRRAIEEHLSKPRGARPRSER